VTRDWCGILLDGECSSLAWWENKENSETVEIEQV